MTGPWAVCAASVTGRAHARAAMPNQDTFAVARAGNGLILALADGASDARDACVASSVAVAVGVAAVARELDHRAPRDSAGWHSLADNAAAAIVRGYVKRIGRSRLILPSTKKDFATTLTVAVVSPPWCAVMAIGDGFAVTRSGADQFGLLAPPTRPGVAPVFLPWARSGQVQRVVARIDDLTGVAISSDGMDTLLLQYEQAIPGEPVTGAWRQLFAIADDAGSDEMRLTRVLASDGVCRLTEDDKTLVMAVPS